MKPSPQAIVEVRFKTAEEGGKKVPICSTSGKNFYSCPMGFDGEYFDCRVYMDDRKIEPGGTYRLAVQFLSPNSVLPRLHAGLPIILWEGRVVAEGKVLEVLAQNVQSRSIGRDMS